jgi:alkylation response protein AidB-like acyl-CoA dehydrogenase
MTIDEDLGTQDVSESLFDFDEAAGQRLLAEAAQLRPLLERDADRAEETGELTQEVVDALSAAGLFSMAAPRRIGGLAQSSQSMAKVAAELAKGCPSTAWVYTIYNSCLWFASKLPTALQSKIFSDGIVRICSPQNGMGQLVEDGDGYTLTGRWSYATGSHHAAVTMVPVLSPDQQPMLAVMPMTDVEIDYTWHVAGMKGTGSDTVVANAVRVPASNLAPFSDIVETPPVTIDAAALEPCDFWVNYPILRAKALGVLVGCAEGLLEVVAGKSGAPIIYSSYAHKSDSAAYHAAIGEAATQIRGARRLVESSCARIDNAARDRRVLSVEERAEARGEGALIINVLTTAVERLMDLGGSSGFGTTAPAQRFWRDFSIASRHVIFNAQISYETVGRRVLGIEPGIVELEML